MFVADPLFSIWLAIAFFILLFSKRLSERRMFWVKVSLSISVLYWLIGITNKIMVDNAVEKHFKQKNIAVKQYFTTPTFFNNLLWYIVAEHDSGYYIGYRSVFDKKETIDFHYAPKRTELLKLSNNEKDKELLIRFAQGYYTADLWHDTLVLNVLRFGEMGGWADATPRFAFYYYLQYPDDNKLIVQRGRFAKWNKETISEFINRIKGI
jgi:inner membrane protein